MVVADVYGFQEFQQRRTFVPWGAVGLVDYVVAVEGRQRNALYIGDAQRIDEGFVFTDNLVENFLREVYQVHLVDCQYDVLDAQQGNQIGVTAGLGDYSGTCVDQNNGQVGCRSAGNHVAGVLFVSRSVGDDELAVVGREIAVGYVNGDTLFAFGFQTVEQQGIVDVLAGISYSFAVAFEGIQLVFVQFLTVEEQTADEGGFSVVYRTGCQEAQQVFLFVFLQKFLDGHGASGFSFHRVS